MGKIWQRLICAATGVSSQWYPARRYCLTLACARTSRTGSSQPRKRQSFSALHDANAWEYVKKLPKGLEATIGEKGARLSGGQKQHLSIARALFRNPRVMILDEATSALDTESESLIQEAFERLMRNRTTFVLVHRLSTIRNTRHIIEMKRDISLKLVRMRSY